jgi:hypothetical protein
MKVSLDLSRLLAEHEITRDEYDRLLKLAAKDTRSLAFDILFAFGVVGFVVNFAFWVGSMWGERDAKGHIVVSDHVFAICWALVLIATGIWGASQNRRWIINTVAVFGGIHFYTRWFLHLGASPGTVVIAGLLAIAGAVALWSWNNELQRGT